MAYSQQRKAARHRWYKLGQRRCYCGVQLNWITGMRNSATVEHLVPSSKGGTWAAWNTMIICRECNQKRADRDWIRWIESTNPPKKEWLIAKYVASVKQYDVLKVNLTVKRPERYFGVQK